MSVDDYFNSLMDADINALSSMTLEQFIKHVQSNVCDSCYNISRVLQWYNYINYDKSKETPNT
jgi:hypothetical protein